MNPALYILFYAGSACFVASAALTLHYARSAEPRPMRLSIHALGAALVCFTVCLILRGAAWGQVPLTSMADSLLLFTILCSCIAICIVKTRHAPALLPFYIPPLALIVFVNAFTAHHSFAQAPRELPGALLVLHVGMAFVAYAFFFIASMTSAAYLCLAFHLKRHRSTWLARSLPSLEELDTLLHRLMVCGYPLFVLALALGLSWAWLGQELLGPRWWLAPKVVLSVFMAFFYAATFHLRRAGRLRGSKLAYHVMTGFLTLLALYVVLSLLHVREYHFWGGAP